MPNQKAVSRFRLASGGTMYAIGIRGGLTGRPSEYMLIDDPVKDQKEADSILVSQQNWEWWMTTARPRRAPWAPVVLVYTPWHELDLGQRFQRQQAEDETAGRGNYDKWKVVRIPAKADHNPVKGETDILGRKPGEYMVSARGRSNEEWEATENITIPRFWQALYQGRPTAGDGDILLESWWRRYDTPLWVQRIDGSFDVPGYDLTQSWDFTFDDTKGSDFVVGQVWARKDADSFLIYQVRARLSFPETVDAVLRVTRLFPNSRRKIIEKKANGAAVISSLRKKVPGMIPVSPDQSKVARAEAVSVFVRSHNFWLPTIEVAYENPVLAFDVQAFITECTSFPRGTHDDQVDAWSQYAKMTYLEGGQGRLLSAAKRSPRSSIPNQGQATALTPMQRRLAASKGTDQ
jgi:predicted phage terminase large subunit-like protein